MKRRMCVGYFGLRKPRLMSSSSRLSELPLYLQIAHSVRLQESLILLASNK
jgi:hypothetical protein